MAEHKEKMAKKEAAKKEQQQQQQVIVWASEGASLVTPAPVLAGLPVHVVQCCMVQVCRLACGSINGIAGFRCTMLSICCTIHSGETAAQLSRTAKPKP